MAVDVQRKLAAVPHTQNFESPLAPANANLISSDGHSALLRFEIAGNDTETSDRVKPAVQAVDDVQSAHPGFTLGEFGDASTEEQINKKVQDDFGKALVTSLPITLIILLFAFGALVAAGVPLLLALTAVMATIGIIGPLSHVIGGVDTSINEVILLIGLAVGVDYSMFYLRREREEREAGRSEEAALAAAAATSGRAVLVSGFTVMIAMAGMYLAGTPTFESFATGTILVVAVALVGSLTVLPAILSWLGDRVEKGGVPIIKNQAWNAGESGAWAKVLNPVLRHPVISLLLAGGLLVFLALPALRLHTANESVESLPQDVASIQTYNRIQDTFPGGGIPAVVAVSSDNGATPAGATGHRADGGRSQGEPELRVPHHDRHLPGSQRHPGQHPDRRQRHRLEVECRAGRAAGQDHSGDDRVRTRRQRRRDRLHGLIQGLQRRHEVPPAARLRLRADRGVPAAALHVPLDRHSDQGDHPQPALGGGRLRRDRLDLPGRPLRVVPGVQLDRRDHLVDAPVPLRGPLRVVDGLPRLHPHPDP